MKFIVFLFLINFIIFSPRYFLGLPKVWNPLAFLFVKNTLRVKFRSLFYSRNIDPLRLAFEFSLMSLLFSTISFDNTIAIGLLSIVATVSLLFSVYIGVVSVYLQKTPVIKSDWMLLNDSMAFFKGVRLLAVCVLLIVAVLVFVMFYYLNSVLLTQDANPFLNIIFFCLISFLGLRRWNWLTLAKYRFTTVFSPIIYTMKSFQSSNRFKNFPDYSKEEIIKENKFTNIRLRKKPNLHIISLESYGSIVYQEPDLFKNVLESLEKWNRRYAESKIYSTSSYTVPPLFASGTKFSYSTLLFGMVIEDDIKEDLLFHNLKNFHHYESLFHLTKREGYTNFLLNGILGDFENLVDFEKVKKSLNFDTLLHNDHLGYEGQKLKFMKIRECPPDQFTIGKGLEIAKRSNKPYTFFYPSLNSHVFFDSPISIVEDWKQLNDVAYRYETTMDENKPVFDRYIESIDYAMNAVFDIIHKTIEEDDIFILYGDHQPSKITDQKYGKDTQMHIVSRNKDFIKEWEKYGFTDGIIPELGGDHLKFEGFYSALMTCLNKCYGADPDLDIPYFKDGLAFAKSE